VAQSGKIDCNYVFINTPSIDELRRRLLNRGTESEETLNKRIGNAEAEVKLARKHPEVFTKFIINDNQDKFIKDACTYLTSSNMYPQLNI
jgi:guanylate kinase